jgi:hypothetical protein
MMRVFERGARKELSEKIVNDLSERIFNVSSADELAKIHADFCDWGTKKINQVERVRNGAIISPKCWASYGQIAKTLDVTLKVAIYYCHLPNCERSLEICRWLNAAVDTTMMKNLDKNLPKSLKKVDKETYSEIQSLVRKSIKRDHNNAITCPQWEDIHWEEANRLTDRRPVNEKQWT